MNYTRLSFCLFLSFLTAFPAASRTQSSTDLWQGEGWKGNINEQGHVTSLVFYRSIGNDTIPFAQGRKGVGPTFYVNMGKADTTATWQAADNLAYKARLCGVSCELRYTRQGQFPALQITLRNEGHVVFQPTKAGIKLGIDTYMDHYPQWNGKYFPTLLYNGRTHFYGYMQSPAGHSLALTCAQPIASWSVDYNLGYQDPPPHWFMGHRITSVNLDLINALPLPEHCPQNLHSIKPGQTLTWTICMMPVEEKDMERQIYQNSGLPMLDLPRTNYDAGERASFRVFARNPEVTVNDDNGNAVKTEMTKAADGEWLVSGRFTKAGLFCVNVADGKWSAQGLLTIHEPWKWCMQRARESAWKYKQKATSHAESWYGFYSAFIAAKHFPEPDLDEMLDRRFEKLFTMLHDTAKMEPKFHKSRIQNTSTTIGLLVKRYEAYQRLEDLERAARLGDWLIKFSQAKNGAYMNGRTIYTAVIYVAKSMLELYEAEQALAARDKEWKKRANRHYLSAKRAIDQMVDANGDFDTEGEMTYEDGMISCAALQIGAFALLQNNAKARRHYTEAMLSLLRGHDCLTQLHVPDARRRGGTLRFWEAQYDVMMLPNMINSPHGWSAWRCYATYYAYLLTGNVEWLRQTYNAMGAFSNLIEKSTGNVRWAFVVDPFLKVRQTCKPDTHYTADSLSFGNPHPDLYPTRSFVIGEQYVDMVSDWQGVNTQDNDVHEVFKCMGETVLTNAFIAENEDGQFTAFNCKVAKQGEQIVVEVDEPQVTSLHCNLRRAHNVSFRGKAHSLPAGFLGWIKVKG